MLLPTTKDQEPSVRDPDLPNFNRSGDAHDEVSRAMAAGGRDKCAMDGARPSQDMDVLPREKRPTGRGDSPEPARSAWSCIPRVEKKRPRFPAASSRSEEHTSELQSLMRSSYAVFC